MQKFDGAICVAGTWIKMDDKQEITSTSLTGEEVPTTVSQVDAGGMPTEDGITSSYNQNEANDDKSESKSFLSFFLVKTAIENLRMFHHQSPSKSQVFPTSDG